MFKELLQRLNDPSEELLKMVNAGLNALTKGVPIEQLVEHIEFIRYHIASVVSDARRRKGGVGDGEFFLPGFNMAKGKISRKLFRSVFLQKCLVRNIYTNKNVD